MKKAFGRVPQITPKVNWEVTEIKNDTVGKYKVITKTLVGHVDNTSFPSISVNIKLTLTIPANSTTSVPVIMEFGFIFPPGFRMPNSGKNNNEPSWQQQVCKQTI